MGKQCQILFWGGGSKITADSDCSHEIKRCLLLGRKVVTNLDIQRQRHYFANKGPSSQGYRFSSIHVWMWVWVNSGSWWWTGRPGMLQFVGSQRVGHDWATELNWTRLVITFLPRSKHLLISWLQSPSAMILEPQKIKSDTVSTVSPSICHEVMGPDAMILVFWMLRFKPKISHCF